MASATGAARSSFKVDAEKEGTLTLDRTKEDLAQMVALCCNNGYHISVHFEQFGVYRNGDVIRALYNIDKGLLDDFINGQSVLEMQKTLVLINKQIRLYTRTNKRV